MLIVFYSFFLSSAKKHISMSDPTPPPVPPRPQATPIAPQQGQRQAKKPPPPPPVRISVFPSKSRKKIRTITNAYAHNNTRRRAPAQTAPANATHSKARMPMSYVPSAIILQPLTLSRHCLQEPIAKDTSSVLWPPRRPCLARQRAARTRCTARRRFLYLSQLH